MSDVTQASHDAAEAFEARRRRRLRLFAFGTTAYVVAIVLMIVVWRGYSRARLAGELARLRAAGEPLLPADFNPSTALRDFENAAFAYENAVAAIHAPTNYRDAQGNPTDALDAALGRTAIDPALAGKLVDDNPKALALLRSARGISEVDWGVQFASPMINVLLPQLSGQRRLAKLGVVAARVAAQRGDHAEAVQIALDLARLARRVDEPRTSVAITHLVAVAVHSLLTNSLLEALIPELCVAPDEPHVATRAGETQAASAGVARAASRAAVLELTRELLDDAPIRAGWQRAMSAERAMHADTVRGVVDGTMPAWAIGAPGGMALSSRVLRFVFRPMFELDGARMIGNASLVLRAGMAPSFPEARRTMARIDVIPTAPGTTSIAAGATRALSRMLEASYDRALTLSFRCRAERRMAATALAIRLFELDHGTRPASLAELVPEYLSEPPRDPFAPDGELLGYLPADPKPRLYSLGPDGGDDGGDFTWRESGSVDPDRLDLVYFLDDQRPSTQPAGKTPSP
ncbi:MAG: hypothetical protein CHACPFDD_04043 [Phycisphaerae bacterium]|nr:hypothetical protein [Phycisphaerae bacterium]